MKAIVMIKLCVAFLVTIVPEGVRTQSIIEVLNDIAKDGTTINRVFKPFADGFLGPSQLGISYKGYFIPLSINVTMKFTPMSNESCSRNEYAMYTYLGAMKKPNAEFYGIPSIYYYGKWNDHTMLATKFIKSSPQPIYKVVVIEEWDILVLFREFVKMIKYIHSRGVIHRDIKLENMIIEDGQGYIFNFGLSRNLADRRTRRESIQAAKQEFIRFLWALFKLQSIQIQQWFGFSDEDVSQVTDISDFRTALSALVIANQGKRFTGLRRVFNEFAQHSLSESTGSPDSISNWTPFYDELYAVIFAEIRLRGEITSSDPFISRISDPFGWNDWSRSGVDYEHFERMYPN